MSTEPEDQKKEDMGYNWKTHDTFDHRIARLWNYQSALEKESVPVNLMRDLRVKEIFDDRDTTKPLDTETYAALVDRRRMDGVDLIGEARAIAYDRANLAYQYALAVNSMFLDEDLQQAATDQLVRSYQYILTIGKDLKLSDSFVMPAELNPEHLALDPAVFNEKIMYLRENQGSCWDKEIASLPMEKKTDLLKAAAADVANGALDSACLKISVSEVFMSVAASVYMFKPLGKSTLARDACVVTNAAGLILASAGYDLKMAEEARNAFYVMDNMHQPYFIFQP